MHVSFYVKSYLVHVNYIILRYGIDFKYDDQSSFIGALVTNYTN